MNDIPQWLSEQNELPAWLDDDQLPGWLTGAASGHTAPERAARERQAMAAYDRARRARADRNGTSALLTPTQEVLRRKAEAIYSRPAYARLAAMTISGAWIPSELRRAPSVALWPTIY